MSGSRKLFGVIMASVWLAACSDGGVTDVAPTGSLLGAHGNGGASVDLSGEWTWAESETLIIPAWAVELAFPEIEAEGSITRASCESSGTLTLVQTGNTFTGTTVRTDHECVTSGGQIFGGDASAFLPQPIIDGEIRGRSFVMHRLATVVECIYHGTISGLEAGVATTLSGGGQCIVPGHPRSPIPVDPPPGGVDIVSSFTATR
jgi:hypothetical protein